MVYFLLHASSFLLTVSPPFFSFPSSSLISLAHLLRDNNLQRFRFRQWVRGLCGKPGVPYNRRFPVRGWSHPINYEFELPAPAAESNILRTQSLCDMPVSCMARSISFRSSWLNLTDIPGALAFVLGTFGRPTSFFIRYLLYRADNYRQV